PRRPPPFPYTTLFRSAARTDASVEFLKWLTAPEQDMAYALQVGNMPIRAGSTQQPDFQKYVRQYPGVDVMVSNLQDARSRPALRSEEHTSELQSLRHL